MANTLNDAALNLSPLNAKAVADFLVQAIIQRPDYARYLTIVQGVTMKQQVIYTTPIDSGVAAGGCDFPTSGAEIVLKDFFYEPKPFGDTFKQCPADLDALFQARQTQVRSFMDKYDWDGSDWAAFLTMMMLESANGAFNRFLWLGDSAAAASGAATSGLINAAKIPLFSAVEGIWKDIFAKVTAGTVNRYTITENAAITKVLQETLAADRGVAILNELIEVAPIPLRNATDAVFLVSGKIYRNIKATLQKNSIYTTMDWTVNGVPVMAWDGYGIVNMETVWDKNLKTYFEKDSTNHLWYLPNRVVMLVPSAVHAPLLNADDIMTVKTNQVVTDTKELFILRYGSTLQGLVVDVNGIAVAY